ncbi:LytR/AlgR family response regulator transcription factor [Aurantibacillus circumpalustris]|uniref:LytR/AlgR family response regulator transcription factor n=1 Tax=Aurantibacillus circumpalustris TaxID=3036359 RepID=UPI00295BB018|nr:response regulator transcription factor [Aurantibacillus circumpalustris]
MQYDCIIVEDEPLAVEILESHIRNVPFLNLQASCNDAIEALNFLRTNKVDLIFLDIHLPKLKGLDFLATLKNPPKVIITTAYHQYALESYNFNVIDYLLKPIEFTRFLKAINKLNTNKAEMSEKAVEDIANKAHMFFNINKKKIKIYLEDILYIESQKEYIKIHTHTKDIVTKFPLSDLDELLSKADFLRIHRSFIVSKKKIEAFNASDVEISGKQIPIGRSYKELVQLVLSQLF